MYLSIFPNLSQTCDQLFRECHEFVYALTCLHVHLSPKESTHVPSALLLIAISFLIDLALHIEAAERESWRVSPMYRTVFVGGVCFVSTVRLLPQEMSIGGECDKNGKSPVVCGYWWMLFFGTVLLDPYVRQPATIQMNARLKGSTRHLASTCAQYIQC